MRARKQLSGKCTVSFFKRMFLYCATFSVAALGCIDPRVTMMAFTIICNMKDAQQCMEVKIDR